MTTKQPFRPSSGVPNASLHMTAKMNNLVPATIGPDTRTDSERQAAAAIGKGFQLYFDFIKRSLLTLVGKIPWGGIVIPMVLNEPTNDRKLDALVEWLAEGQLKSAEGRAFLQRIGEGKILLYSIFDVLTKTKKNLEQAGIPVTPVQSILSLFGYAK